MVRLPVVPRRATGLRLAALQRAAQCRAGAHRMWPLGFKQDLGQRGRGTGAGCEVKGGECA